MALAHLHRCSGLLVSTVEYLSWEISVSQSKVDSSQLGAGGGGLLRFPQRRAAYCNWNWANKVEDHNYPENWDPKSYDWF